MRSVRISVSALLAGCALAVAQPASAAPGDPPGACNRVTPETVEDQLGEQTVQVVSAGNAVITGTLYLPRDATQYNPAAAVLMTHGGGGSRASLRPKPGNLAQALRDAGFAVLAFDSRGHGDSRWDTSGNATVTYDFAAPDGGVEDVRALVRLVAACRAIRQEAAGDPVVGFVGASNGAGLQLNSAASEPALDAIIPMLSWGDLPEDLAPNGVPKAYTGLVFQTFDRGHTLIDPVLARWREAALAGSLTDEAREFLAARSTSARADRIRVPTLLLQGTLDGLFPLEGAMRNFERIRRSGTPVKLVTFCSGHNATAIPERSCRGGDVMTEIIFAWLNHHLRGAAAELGPPIDWYGPDNRFRGASEIPANGTSVSLPVRQRSSRKRRTRRPARPRHRRQRTRALATLHGPGGTGGDTQTYASPAPGSESQSTLRVRLLERSRRGCRQLFGIPRITVTGTVDGAEGFLFAELQESNVKGERRTVNLNTMPVRLPRGRFARTFDLHGVSWIVGTGNYLDLELTTGSDMYLEPQGSFRVRIDRIKARLPVGAIGRGRNC